MTATGERAENAGFRPDIQGLRAIAVTIVVIYHLYPSALPGGFAGVDVFFVISGYLITGQLWRGYARAGKVSLASFWGQFRRRLVPAAALVLVVTWIAARVIEPATELAHTAQQVLASALYYQNWQLASDAVNYLKIRRGGHAGAALLVACRSRSSSTSPGRCCSCSRRSSRRGSRPAAPGQAAERTRRCGLVLVLLTAALVIASLAYSVAQTNADAPAAYFVTTTRLWELARRRRPARPRPRPADPRAGAPGLAGLVRPGARRRVGLPAHRVDAVPRGARAAPSSARPR